MAEVNLRSWPEISQAADSLQLNPSAAMLEHILARIARIGARLDEYDRRSSTVHPPFRPEPDPPDGPPVYAATAQPYQPYTPQPDAPQPCFPNQPPPSHNYYQPPPQPPQTYQPPPYTQQQSPPSNTYQVEDLWPPDPTPPYSKTEYMTPPNAHQLSHQNWQQMVQPSYPPAHATQQVRTQPPLQHPRPNSRYPPSPQPPTYDHPLPLDWPPPQPEYLNTQSGFITLDHYGPPNFGWYPPHPSQQLQLVQDHQSACWDSPSQRQSWGLVASDQPAAVAAPSTLKKVISDPGPDLSSLRSLESIFQPEKCFWNLTSTSENMCSVDNTFDEHVADLEKESEKFSSCREIITWHAIPESVELDRDDYYSSCFGERRMPEKSHNFDDKSINDGDGEGASFNSSCDSALDLDDRLIPPRTGAPDRSLDSTVRSPHMGPFLEQLQSEPVDKVKEYSCQEQPIVVRQPLLPPTSPYCSALTPMAAAAVPRQPQPRPAFYSRPLFVTVRDRIWEEVPRNIVIPIGADVANINHRSTTLNTDGRLIPPRNDMPWPIEWGCPKYLGIWNCIVCITKKGIQPAGIHIDREKIGLSSVSAVLLQGGTSVIVQLAGFASKLGAEEVVGGLWNLLVDEVYNGVSAKAAEWRHSTILLCAKQHFGAFNQGGEVSPKLMFTMLFVVSWFPP